MNTRMTAVLGVLTLTLGASALASDLSGIEANVRSTRQVSKGLGHALLYFSNTARANTLITIRDLVNVDGRVSFKMRAEVVSDRIDSRLYGMLPIEISESLSIRATRGVPMQVELEVPAAATAGEAFELVRAAILETMEKSPAPESRGLNLDTPFARTMESIAPGVRRAFVNSLVEMSYNDRKDEIAGLAAEIVSDLAFGECTDQ